MKFLVGVFLLLLFNNYLCATDHIRVPLKSITLGERIFKAFDFSLKRLYNKVFDRSASIILQNVLDSQFCGKIALGKTKKKFKVIFDTGSSDLWVQTTNCGFFDIVCWLWPHKYSCSDPTCTARKTPFTINYILGEGATGYLSADTLTIGDFRITNQTFGEAINHHSWLDMIFDRYDGIFGLGFPEKSQFGVTPPFFNMFEQTSINPVFGFFINRNKSSEIEGEVTFGASNPSYYIGEFTYAKLIDPTEWMVALDSLKISKNNMDICGQQNCSAIVDTGSSLIYGPKKLISQLNRLIGADLSSDGSFIVDCKMIKSLPIIIFEIGGTEFPLYPEDYVINNWFEWNCKSAFKEIDLKRNENVFYLGIRFLHRYYTEFDVENKQIGFAKAVSL